MKGAYFFYKMKLQMKQIFKSHWMLMKSGEKNRTEVNYWSKDSQRNSENIYENMPNYIYRQPAAHKNNIFQVWSFLDFISSNGNSNNSDVESQ